MGHSCLLKVSVDIELGNWNDIWLWEVNQTLLHFLWYCCLKLKIILNVDTVLQLKRPFCSFVASWEALHISSVLGMDVSINWKMSWVPRFCEISADGCISVVVYNAFFGELICFVDVTGSNANNVKAWRETFGVEDTWTFTARAWTQLVNQRFGII